VKGVSSCVKREERTRVKGVSIGGRETGEGAREDASI
jgi:hypothetical protein